MIFQGLFNILDLYFNDIDLFYNNIDHYFRDKIIDFFGTNHIEKEDTQEILDEITLFLIKVFVELGFRLNEVEAEFLDPFLQIQDDDIQVTYTPVELYEKKIAPILYEIFLEKIVDYLVDTEVAPLMLKFKDEGFLPIEFIMELRNLKNLIERDREKHENLRKYIQIQKQIIKKFWENKKNIESLEDIKEPEYKLQIIYLIYRIIHFFHLQIAFDFSHIESYLEENIDEWLIDVPLVTLKNPDIYFCGIYLAKHLRVKLDKEKIKNFLLNLNSEAGDRYVSPLIEATDGAYYFLKSTELMKLWLSQEQINALIKTEPEFFEPNYLKNLETSQLVVILKLYRYLNIPKMESEINALTEEIERRITPEGIKQFRDGFVSSEATYYVLFHHYMNNTLEKLREYDILDNIVSRIYRNLELLDFSIDTNFDLVSELFYSLESLKLFNCIETKEMIIHLAKFLFPQEIVEKISTSKEIIRSKAKFRHLKVNRITGETVY
ncbi:MAG: hypothetical protein ACFE94_17065 [Candidatus Hodarchaeota archaeon]